MFPAGQFLLGLQLEGRDGWDQGTTGTDRYIGSFGGPAVSGAEMDSVLSKVHKCVLYIHVCVRACVRACVHACMRVCVVCVSVCMYGFECVCVCVCVYMYECVFVCVCVVCVVCVVCGCVCGVSVCVCVYVWV